MKINWLVRIKNKEFWLAIIPAMVLLIQAVGNVFGIEIDLGETGTKLVQVVNTVFVVLTILGIVVDPTTDGVGDSNRALGYVNPNKD